MSNTPVIRIECSLELLNELHAAHAALLRAMKRSSSPRTAPNLERLIVSVHAARGRSSENEAPAAP